MRIGLPRVRVREPANGPPVEQHPAHVAPCMSGGRPPRRPLVSRHATVLLHARAASRVPDSVVMRMSGHRTRTVFDRYNIVENEDVNRQSAGSRRDEPLPRLDTKWTQQSEPRPRPKRPHPPSSGGASGKWRAIQDSNLWPSAPEAAGGVPHRAAPSRNQLKSAPPAEARSRIRRIEPHQVARRLLTPLLTRGGGLFRRCREQLRGPISPSGRWQSDSGSRPRPCTAYAVAVSSNTAAFPTRSESLRPPSPGAWPPHPAKDGRNRVLALRPFGRSPTGPVAPNPLRAPPPHATRALHSQSVAVRAKRTRSLD